MTINVNPPTADHVPAQIGPDDYIRMSATSGLPEPSRKLEEVAKLIDVSKCIGCKACQSACTEWNALEPPIEENVGVYDNPHDLMPDVFTLMRYTEWVNPETDSLEWLIRKDGCMHCAEPGCLAACPSPGAIVQYSNGVVDFIHDKCIGCGYCIKGCPFDIPRVSKVDHKAYKCTLCSDRIAVGQGPACAKACPTKAIVFGPKEEMKQHAAQRVADLRSRGYDKAGLYDPAGVGGTHVMYVLHHADKPHIYAALPDAPKISPIVRTWKGIAKYLGLGALAGTVAAAVAHAVFIGPSRVSRCDEADARKALDKAAGAGKTTGQGRKGRQSAKGGRG